MLAVVALAVLVTGLITVPLVRTSAVQVARERLASQVDLLASLDPLPTNLARPVSTAFGGARFALVTSPPEGAATGAARSYVTDEVRAALSATRTYSGDGRGTLGRALVEARATTSGEWLIVALPRSELDPALGRATLRVVLALLGGLAVAAVAAVLLARWLTRPLHATADAARRLARGERGVTLPPAQSSEAAELAAALTSLDRALAQSEGRQREFLLSISHDLRTPLSALRGYGEALADDLVPAGEIADVGRTLVRETERLDQFVADLLGLARLEAEDFRLVASAVAVRSLVADVVAAWAGRAATLSVGLSGRADAAPEIVVTDARRLRQVLDGLVENALRATPTEGTVTLTATEGPGAGATFAVADSGPGFTEDDLAVAFDRGALHARYRETRKVGTGLGLSIATRLVTRLGGTIAVRNGKPGAVFVVTLPGLPPPSS
jgi:two-component system sensor histidine kinase BaeS